jgi:hypothetical protein
MATSSSYVNTFPNLFFNSLFTHSNDLKKNIPVCSNAYLPFLMLLFPSPTHPLLIPNPNLSISLFD